MGATMRDVAELANTSVATVSAVVNGTKYVSPALRRRVEQAIRTLNYRPNRLGRALATNRTQMIAYVVRSTTNPFFPSLIQAVENTTFQRGYGLMVCNSEGQLHRAEKYREFLQSHVDGVLINLSGSLVQPTFYEAFLNQGKPVVGLAGETVVPTFDGVISDDATGFSQMTQYLIDLGHRRFAFVGPRHTLRVDAVEKALHDAGLGASLLLPPRGPSTTEDDGYRLTREIFQGAFRPTALICFNDVLAMGAVRACNDMGLAVPEDVSVTGCDDTLGKYSIPRLTTIRVPTEQMGHAASSLLLDRIEGKVLAPPQVHSFTPELVVAGSTGPAPA